MGKIKKIFTNVRVIIMLVAIVLAIILINPQFGEQGIAIRSVALNSAASQAGMESPGADVAPTSLERIVSINNQPIRSVDEYYMIVESFDINTTFIINTNRGDYLITVEPLVNVTQLNETRQVIREQNVTQVIDGVNTTVLQNVTVEEPIVLETIIGPADIGLQVIDAPGTNIRKGLDLQGGARVLLVPEDPLTEEEFQSLQGILEQRLNVFGLSDIRVQVVYNVPRALGGQPEFIMVEVAGANIDQITQLLARQGKFEAKIANQVVFIGGQRDIVYIQKGPGASGIQNCGRVTEGVSCQFFFGITLSSDAARRFADATRDLGIDGQHLTEDIELYLDDVLVDSLRIAADLRGRQVTQVQITGSGVGSTEREAREDAMRGLRELQSVLETGSLPVRLEIVKADGVSPILGEAFTRNAIIAGLLALLAVLVVVFIRYRTPAVVLPMGVTLITEVVLLLGLASLINWNLDLAAIAGIIIVVGSGVDHQIVIVDETLKGKSLESWRVKLKKAFTIIMGAYFTTVVAMLPLMFAGAGLLKGFAITTILGVTIGVLITRPAFGAIAEILLGDKS